MSIQKTNIVVLLLIVFGSGTLFAQRDYATGFGVKSWPYWGVTVKHFVTDQTALEFTATTKWEGLMLDGLYEFHHNAFKTSNFNVLYGFGGHIGWWNNDLIGHPWLEDGETVSIGINGIVGIEYTFDEIPFSVSLDYKPLFVFAQTAGIDPESIAFSVRYNIK